MTNKQLAIYLIVLLVFLFAGCSDSEADSHTGELADVGVPNDVDLSDDSESLSDASPGDDTRPGEGDASHPDAGADTETEDTTDTEPEPSDPMSPFNLDESGQTIPDTDYAIPEGAIFMATTGDDNNPGTESAPVKTLNKALAVAPHGGTVVVRGGVYYDGHEQADKPYYHRFLGKKMTFQAYPHEQVWFDGSEIQSADKWTSDGEGRWWMDWSTPQFCDGKYYVDKYDAQPLSNQGPCAHFDANSAPEFPVATDPQMVFVDGEPLQQMLELSDVTDGKFYYDWENRRLYIPADPGAHEVAAAVRTNFIITGEAGTAIKGIGFRRYATNEQSNLTGAAVYLGGSGYLLENSVFTEMAGGSQYMAPQNSTMNHVAIVNNGFTTSGGNGHSEKDGRDDLVIKNSLISNNNTENMHMHCTVSCGRGAMKMAHMEGFTVKNNIFKNSEGHGIWCDLNCSGAVIVNNLIMNNTRSGILYEVSSDGIIASNLLINNGTYGIRVAAATTQIYNNTIISNHAKGGMWIYDDPRNKTDSNLGGSPTSVGPDTAGVDIVNNIVFNTHDTVGGITAQGTDTTHTNTVPDEFFDRFDFNAYYRQDAPANRLIRWYEPSGETTYYSSAEFFAAKGFDGNAIDITEGEDPFFVDFDGGDYHVRPDSLAYQSGSALPAEVAEAIGVAPDAGQNRGALVWPQP